MISINKLQAVRELGSAPTSFIDPLGLAISPEHDVEGDEQTGQVSAAGYGHGD
jgi:hypothetical protein